MKLLEGESLRRRLLESYSKNPKGWSFVISPSGKNGFCDAVVSGSDGTWMLKMDSIFKPTPIVLGSLTEDSPELRPAGPFQYGYRNLPPGLILQMLSGGGAPPRDKAEADFSSLLKSETVVPEEGRPYAEGPFVFTSRRNVDLSERQRDLDIKLASEMQRLLRTRYPAYG
ncbi:MAG: hypothetical protein ABSB53_01015 [Nitrososphaerales archaeon]|jgi:hypothetical protein